MEELKAEDLNVNLVLKKEVEDEVDEEQDVIVKE